MSIIILSKYCIISATTLHNNLRDCVYSCINKVCASSWSHLSINNYNNYYYYLVCICTQCVCPCSYDDHRSILDYTAFPYKRDNTEKLLESNSNAVHCSKKCKQTNIFFFWFWSKLLYFGQKILTHFDWCVKFMVLLGVNIFLCPNTEQYLEWS